MVKHKGRGKEGEVREEREGGKRQGGGRGRGRRREGRGRRREGSFHTKQAILLS